MSGLIAIMAVKYGAAQLCYDPIAKEALDPKGNILETKRLLGQQ
jgi:hypothetical protein